MIGHSRSVTKIVIDQKVGMMGPGYFAYQVGTHLKPLKSFYKESAHAHSTSAISCYLPRRQVFEWHGWKYVTLYCKRMDMI